jgi:hypothetical protein
MGDGLPGQDLIRSLASFRPPAHEFSPSGAGISRLIAVDDAWAQAIAISLLDRDLREYPVLASDLKEVHF